jgi:type IV secretory pathway TraG/TraD family ATPase VirD4
MSDIADDILKMYVGVIKGAAKVGMKAGNALGQAASNAASDYSAGRGARRGILAPGDPPPPPNAGDSYYDFRGVLSLRKIPPEYQTAEFPLGRYVDPARGPRQPIGLPASALETHAAVVAPTGSGKTTSIIVPWIVAGLRAGWSVVAIDAKGDLADRVKKTVRASGQRLGIHPQVLDYTNPATSARWNWCSELDSDEAISSAVDAIAGKECPEHTAKTFWLRDKRILRGLFELVMASPRRDQVTAELLLNVLRDQDKLAKNLQRYPSSPANGRLKGLLQMYPDKYAEEIADIENKLDVLTTPKLKAVTGQAGIRAADVLRAPSFVSVVAPLHHGDMASMLSGLFINQLLFRAYDRYAHPGGVPLLLVLDEAAELKNQVDFKSLLSVARAAQVAALIVVQDVTQFDDKIRSVVFGNCGTLIYLPGTTHDSAKYLSDQLGQHPVQTTSTSVGPAANGLGNHRTQSRQSTMVPVLGEREIHDLPFGQFAAVVRSRPVADRPFLVDLTQPQP